MIRPRFESFFLEELEELGRNWGGTGEELGGTGEELGSVCIFFHLGQNLKKTALF
jgi:hypothetical protein